VVAGEFYEDEVMYREVIRSRNLTEHIHLVAEYIASDRVSTFFSASDVVVQPYESATQSGVVQTAYHFERPVIVTDVGGLAEVVPHEVAGLVVPPRDAEKLAEAVSRFFEQGFAARLAPGVRRQKERHSWSHLLDVLEELAD
jgi:glycosyltransferase involved in cell wall biosynthesis